MEAMTFMLTNLKEQRRIRKHIKLKDNSIFSIPTAVDEYWKDNFGLRNTTIKLANSLSYHVFKKSPTDKVLKGKGDWLFYGNNASKYFYQRKDLFTKKTLRKLYSYYRRRLIKLKKKNIDYMLLITPSKASIYPEYYNDCFIQTDKKNRLEQFLSYVKKQKQKLPIYYLKRALRQIKKQSKLPLYIKTDSHWNSIGAYFAYANIMKKLNNNYNYNFSPIKLNYFKQHVVTKKGGFGRMLGVFNPPKSKIYLLKDRIEDKAFNAARNKRGKLRKKTGDHTIPLIINRKEGQSNSIPISQDTVLVYRNSFFKKILPFFSKHFSKSIYFSNIYKTFSLQHVEKYKPDLVIEQFTDFQFG